MRIGDRFVSRQRSDGRIYEIVNIRPGQVRLRSRLPTEDETKWHRHEWANVADIREVAIWLDQGENGLDYWGWLPDETEATA